jgi:hypothetical protein
MDWPSIAARSYVRGSKGMRGGVEASILRRLRQKICKVALADEPENVAKCKHLLGKDVKRSKYNSLKS